MQGITKGTVLGGRYELASEISDAPGLARWLAHDEKLGREVAVTVFPSDSAHAEAALDSARRAAGVDDARLVRVLDAGRDDSSAYIVEEAHTGAHSLADLVRFEPMHPEEARRIVGETATALEAARQRGLHHLILSPRHVLRLADGSIAVTQVAVGGALAGKDDVSSTEASQRDATALVNLLYTALTGQWPGDEADITGLKGLDVAPRGSDGRVASPSAVVDGIPSDLDTTCRTFLNQESPARTPGEVARAISPWSAQMITIPGKARRDDATANDDDTDSFTVRRASETGETPRRSGVGAVGAAAIAAAGTGAAKKAGSSAASSTSTSSTPGRTTSSADDTDPGITPAPAVKSAAAMPRKPLPRRAVSEPDPADATMVGRPMQFDADETTQFTLDDEGSAFDRTSYDPSFEELEPPVPGFHGGTDDPDAGSSKLALGIVSLFVLAALVLAVWGLSGLTGSKKKDAPAAGAPTSSSSSGAPSSSSSSKAPDTAGTPVKILGATFINSGGLRQASSKSASFAIDGDPSTEWMSLRYRSQPWGGYKKLGGLALNLGTSTDVKTIKVTPGKDAPLTADVYVSDEPGTAGTKVGSIDAATSEQSVSSTAKGRYVTIFVPEQTKPAGKNYYQSAIAEVSVEK